MIRNEIEQFTFRIYIVDFCIVQCMHIDWDSSSHCNRKPTRQLQNAFNFQHVNFNFVICIAVHHKRSQIRWCVHCASGTGTTDNFSFYKSMNILQIPEMNIRLNAKNGANTMWKCVSKCRARQHRASYKFDDYDERQITTFLIFFLLSLVRYVAIKSPMLRWTSFGTSVWWNEKWFETRGVPQENMLQTNNHCFFNYKLN